MRKSIGLRIFGSLMIISLLFGGIIPETDSIVNAAPTELIINRGFESGSTGWLLSGDFYADSRFDHPHQGTGYAYLSKADGSYGNNLGGTMEQTVTIPSSATSATLTFWYSISTNETEPIPYDMLDVIIFDTGYNYLATAANLDNTDSQSPITYSQKSFNMTPYIGKTIKLVFEAGTDAGKPTVFRIDDVSLIINTQTQVTLTLYVHEGSASGPIIAGAQVTGQDGAGNSFNQTTNASGYVVISGVPGTWSFTASKSGYQTNSWSQSITAEGTKHAYLLPQATGLPSAPILVSPNNGATGIPVNPVFQWQPVSEAVFYGLYISEPPYGPDHLVFDSEVDYGPIYGTSFTLPSTLQSGVTYYWNMRAVNDFGWGPFSSSWFFTTQQATDAPALLSPGSGTAPGPFLDTLTPTMQWSAVPGADYYALAISEYPYGPSNVIYNPQQLYGTSHQIPRDVLQVDTQENKKYRWQMQAHIGTDWGGYSNILYFEYKPSWFIPGLVTFIDPNLETAIREAINKPTGYIYQEDLFDLTYLDASNRGIQDLTGLEYCIRLSYLDLGMNPITNISQLAGLHELSELYLYENPITDLSPLAELWGLTVLVISGNHITVISPLSGLTNLYLLDLNGNQISDISPIEPLENLIELNLDNNQISAINRVFLRMSKLVTLSLGNNQISNLDMFAIHDDHLRYLNLQHNQITDIRGLVIILSAGDHVDLSGNPLSANSINIYIPQLQARGVDVIYDIPSDDNTPPTCSIQLREQSTTIPIDKVGIGGSFDIFAGASTDNVGITQVHFSCDDSQDGSPQGSWTQWYDWSTSSGDWNASTKVKEWSFATNGKKEVWAEIRDGGNNSNFCHININVYIPILLVHGFQSNDFDLDGIWQEMCKYLTGNDPKGPEDVSWTRVYEQIPYSYYIKRLEGNGYVVYISNYNHKQTEGTHDSIENYAKTLAMEIQAIKLHDRVSKVDIVAHSMGGLVSRTYIENDTQYGGDVNKLIMLGTPNKGVANALTFLNFFDMTSIGGFLCVPEMISGSQFIDDINKHTDTNGVKYYAVAGNKDKLGQYTGDVIADQHDGLVPVYSVFMKDKPLEILEANRVRVPLNHSELPRDFISMFQVKLWLLDIDNSYFIASKHSPGELRIHDSFGRVTGIINGIVTEDIPNSIYDVVHDTVIINPAIEAYWCEIVGSGEGMYGLTLFQEVDGDETSFVATDIPISNGVIHQYTVDWNALSQGQSGVTVQIDSDGDGIFERTITSDSELTADEFLSEPPPPPGPGPEVGGDVYPVNKIAVLTPWIGLSLALVIGAAILLGNRRAQS